MLINIILGLLRGIKKVMMNTNLGTLTDNMFYVVFTKLHDGNTSKKVKKKDDNT